jgi:hypothetical protein
MQGLASLGVGQWLGAAGLVVAPPLVAWLEGKRSAWPLGFATFFLLFGLAHLLFTGDIVALWAALVLTAIIGIISKLKYRYLASPARCMSMSSAAARCRPSSRC